jgi:hypothetical protein
MIVMNQININPHIDSSSMKIQGNLYYPSLMAFGNIDQWYML